MGAMSIHDASDGTSVAARDRATWAVAVMFSKFVIGSRSFPLATRTQRAHERDANASPAGRRKRRKEQERTFRRFRQATWRNVFRSDGLQRRGVTRLSTQLSVQHRGGNGHGPDFARTDAPDAKVRCEDRAIAKCVGHGFRRDVVPGEGKCCNVNIRAARTQGPDAKNGASTGGNATHNIWRGGCRRPAGYPRPREGMP